MSIVCLLPLLVAAAAAQETRPIQIGPVAGLNVSMNTADYHVEGPSRAITPGFFGGVLAEFPISKNASILANLGYYTLGFNDENEKVDVDYPNNKDRSVGTVLKTEGTFSYFAISPAIKFGEAFYIGFNFGVPLSATIKNSITGSLPSWLKDDISPSDKEKLFLVEARIGGLFSVHESESGSLRVGISGSYPLTEAADSPTDNSKLPRLDENFRLPSMMLNLSYLFSIQ